MESNNNISKQHLVMVYLFALSNLLRMQQEPFQGSINYYFDKSLH